MLCKIFEFDPFFIVVPDIKVIVSSKNFVKELIILIGIGH